jgi:hypothetical protein
MQVWLSGDIVGTPCGQYVVANLVTRDSMTIPFTFAQRPVAEETIKRLVSLGWTERHLRHTRALD